jgi:hypothetical protein
MWMLMADSSTCNLRYFPDSQNAADAPGWAASMGAIRNDSQVPNNSTFIRPEVNGVLLSWFRDQYITMANPSSDYGGNPTEGDRQREIRELESFKIIHIDEMAKSEEGGITPDTPNREEVGKPMSYSMTAQMSSENIETDTSSYRTYGASSRKSPSSLSSVQSSSSTGTRPSNHDQHSTDKPVASMKKQYGFLALTQQAIQTDHRVSNVSLEDYMGLLRSKSMSMNVQRLFVLI